MDKYYQAQTSLILSSTIKGISLSIPHRLVSRLIIESDVQWAVMVLLNQMEMLTTRIFISIHVQQMLIIHQADSLESIFMTNISYQFISVQLHPLYL
jgi:hypothetical protein